MGADMAKAGGWEILESDQPTRSTRRCCCRGDVYRGVLQGPDGGASAGGRPPGCGDTAGARRHHPAARPEGRELRAARERACRRPRRRRRRGSQHGRVRRTALRYLDGYGSVAPRLCDSGVRAWVVHGETGDGGLTDEERRTLEACSRISVITIPARVSSRPMRSLCWWPDSSLRRSASTTRTPD
jgi:hypothetical protein